MVDQVVRDTEDQDMQPAVISEKVVNIRRVAKVVKGGRHLSFSALVVVGDGQGRVGSGLGKAVAIPDAVRKGVTIGQKNLITVPLKGTTIPHVVKAKYGAAIVLLKPAPPGTGLIAGAPVRAVLDMLGAKDIVTKSLKSQNPINVVRATLEALKQFENFTEIGESGQRDATPLVEEEAVQ